MGGYRRRSRHAHRRERRRPVRQRRVEGCAASGGPALPTCAGWRDSSFEGEFAAALLQRLAANAAAATILFNLWAQLVAARRCGGGHSCDHDDRHLEMSQLGRFRCEAWCERPRRRPFLLTFTRPRPRPPPLPAQRRWIATAAASTSSTPSCGRPSAPPRPPAPSPAAHARLLADGFLQLTATAPSTWRAAADIWFCMTRGFRDAASTSARAPRRSVSQRVSMPRFAVTGCSCGSEESMVLCHSNTILQGSYCCPAQLLSTREIVVSRDGRTPPTSRASLTRRLPTTMASTRLAPALPVPPRPPRPLPPPAGGARGQPRVDAGAAVVPRRGPAVARVGAR